MPFGLVDDALTQMFADVTRRRRAAGTHVNYRFVEGAETTTTIRASVQRARLEDLQDLPEGQRTSAAVAVYSVSDLRTVDERTLLVEDAIDWNGEQWKVGHVERWQVGGLDHYKAVAARVER